MFDLKGENIQLKQGRRNGFGIGGLKKFAQIFLVSHFDDMRALLQKALLIICGISWKLKKWGLVVRLTVIYLIELCVVSFISRYCVLTLCVTLNFCGDFATVYCCSKCLL